MHRQDPFIDLLKALIRQPGVVAVEHSFSWSCKGNRVIKPAGLMRPAILWIAFNHPLLIINGLEHAT